jgi:hypothetical protein
MKRPLLEPIELSDVFPPRPKTVVVTMSIGQWDRFLALAYREGYTLLELDDDERPIAAYRKQVCQFAS